MNTPNYKRAFELLADYVANGDVLMMLSSPTAREKRKQIIIEDYLKKAEKEAK
jgi:hypothetical protein